MSDAINNISTGYTSGSGQHEKIKVNDRNIEEKKENVQFAHGDEVSFSPEALAYLKGLEDDSLNISDAVEISLDNLFDQIDKIFEKAGNKALTPEQEKQLSALDKKVESIVGPFSDEESFFSDLTDESVKELENLFKTIDKIFSSGGETPLTNEQEKQLIALENKITEVIESKDFYSGLSEIEAVQVENLFDNIDRMFKISGEKTLTAAQEKQLTSIDKLI